MIYKFASLILCCIIFAQFANSAPPVVAQNTKQTTAYSKAIVNMKQNRRGPFQGIRWFCKDATIHPARPYPCTNRGGGIQHGYWSQITQQMRKQGYLVANVLADIKTKNIISDTERHDLLQSILLEQFLIQYDQGWIFRKAQFYRGAFQIENEEEAGRKILKQLLSNKAWLNKNFSLIVDSARVLPHGTATPLVGRIRTLASTINNKDKRFTSLRSKIHGRPDAGDAARVRQFKANKGSAKTNKDLNTLSSLIDQLAKQTNPSKSLVKLAKKNKIVKLDTQINNFINKINNKDNTNSQKYAVIAQTLAWLRSNVTQFKANDRLIVLDTIIDLDQAGFVLLQKLKPLHKKLSRTASVQRLFSNIESLYGSGLLTGYEFKNLNKIKQSFTSDITVNKYRELLAYLEKVPVWGGQRLAFHYGLVIKKWSQIESKSELFIPDRLRGTHLLEYAALLDLLSVDLGRISGIEHQLFGEKISTGLTRINPGLAQGKLVSIDELENSDLKTDQAIVIVSETIAELPPVAGILTQFEGNQLSHVQLLARNLGVPNVVVSAEHLEKLNPHLGQWISLASTPKGIVKIENITAPEPNQKVAANKSGVEIKVDLDKLDLDYTEITPTAVLGAKDSGVRTGPKAAHVGELQYHYPNAVSPGLAIPFGAFNQVLQRPFKNTGKTAFAWMIENYQNLENNKNDQALYNSSSDDFLAELREWIINAPLDKEFVKELRQKMQTNFGDQGSYGVFVRSDTNVEDLPGFTGAGLNLTLPHVVGFEKTLTAIKRVWASPFSKRAFGWRQALMDQPQHVYTAILLHKSINSEKSGVLVDTDLFSDRDNAFTVVLNEGVGGGVDGLSAETLVVYGDNETRLYASATAPLRSVLSKRGGVKKEKVSGAGRLLSDQEIKQLRTFVTELPSWFSADDETKTADVEFGFYKDKLYLFQIRPFLENNASLTNPVLKSLDEKLGVKGLGKIDMSETISLN